MARGLHEAVYEEAERRAAKALAEFVAEPSPDNRAEFWRQLDNLRAAGLAIAKGERPEAPRTAVAAPLSGRHRTEGPSPNVLERSS